MTKLIRSSESLDLEADLFEQDFVPIEFDQMAMAETWAECQSDYTEDEDD